MNEGTECRSLLGPNALANNNNSISNKEAQDGCRASLIPHTSYKYLIHS